MKTLGAGEGEIRQLARASNSLLSQERESELLILKHGLLIFVSYFR